LSYTVVRICLIKGLFSTLHAEDRAWHPGAHIQTIHRGKFRMTTDELDQLGRCPDMAALQSALGDLCARFGSVTQLNILPAAHAGKRQALCFVRMASPEEEHRLMSGLGIGRFGGELVVVVDLHAPEPPAMTADLFSQKA